MYHQVSSIIDHMAKSQEEIAKMIAQERHASVHLAQLVQNIPDHPDFREAQELERLSVLLAENITAYLNSIAEFAESLAENLSLVIKELGGEEEE